MDRNERTLNQHELIRQPRQEVLFPIPRIEICEYWKSADNSGFVRKEGRTCYKVSLYGHDRKEFDLTLSSDGLAEQSALIVANEWSKRLNWPIMRTKEVHKTVVTVSVVPA